jgi:hypothetical protein
MLLPEKILEIAVAGRLVSRALQSSAAATKQDSPAKRTTSIGPNNKAAAVVEKFPGQFTPMHHDKALIREAWPWVRVGYFSGTKTACEEIYVYSRAGGRTSPAAAKPRPVSQEIVASMIEPIYTYDHVQVFARNDCQIDLSILRDALVQFCSKNRFQVSPQGQTCE